MIEKRWIAVATVATVALQGLWLIVQAARSNGYYWLDDYQHLLISKEAVAHPSALLDVWGRPLMTLAYVPAVLVGDAAVRATSIVLLAATALLCIRLARAWTLALPWTAAALLLAQPLTARLGYSALPATVFSFVLAAALLLRATGRHNAAVAVATLLPLARLEGLVVLAVWAVVLVRERRVRLVPVLGAGMATWAVAGAAMSGDVLWLWHQSPYGLLGSSYPAAGWTYVFGALPKAIGLGGALALVSFALRSKVDVLVRALAVAMPAFYMVVWGLPAFESYGDAVYLVAASVPLALVAAGALDALLGAELRVDAPVAAIAVGVALLALVSPAIETVPAAVFVVATLGTVAAIVLAARWLPATLRQAGALAALAGIVVVELAFTTPHERAGSTASSYALARRLGDEAASVAVFTQPAFGWYADLDVRSGGARAKAQRLPSGSLVVWDSSQGGSHVSERRLRDLGYEELWHDERDGQRLVLFRRR